MRHSNGEEWIIFDDINMTDYNPWTYNPCLMWKIVTVRPAKSGNIYHGCTHALTGFNAFHTRVSGVTHPQRGCCATTIMMCEIFVWAGGLVP